MQVALGEVDLIPAKIDGLSHPQTVPSHDEDQGRITQSPQLVTLDWMDTIEAALETVAGP